MSTAANITQSASIDLNELADVLTTDRLLLDEGAQHIAVALYRLLARGEPVSRAQLAAKTELPLEEISEVLDSWFGVFYDDSGNVVGFWGLALPEMAVRLELDGRQLHTWCAWDSLFLPQILGKTARVETTAPRGETISLTVGPDGVAEVTPAEAVLTFVRPKDGFDEDVIQSFCHYVLFFPDEQTARAWTKEHPNTFVLSLQQGFELGRIWTEKRFGTALGKAGVSNGGSSA